MRENPRGNGAAALAFPRHPCWVGDHFEGRHVDLRPRAVRRDGCASAGGLTRVALVRGSLVVNSSQGGGGGTRGCSPMVAGRSPTVLRSERARAERRRVSACWLAWPSRFSDEPLSRTRSRGERLVDVTMPSNWMLVTMRTSSCGRLCWALMPSMSRRSIDLGECGCRLSAVRHCPPLPPTIPMLSCPASATRVSPRAVCAKAFPARWDSSTRLPVGGRTAPDTVRRGRHIRSLPPHPRVHSPSRAGRYTLAHGEDWHFFCLGKYSERADNVARVLTVQTHLLSSGNAVARVRMKRGRRAVLRSCGLPRPMRAITVCVSRPRARDRVLLLNPIFPQSVRSASMPWHALQNSSPREQPGSRPVRALGLLCATVEHAAVDEVLESSLSAFLSAVQQRICEVADHVTRVYLRHESGVERPMPAARAALLMAAQQQ